MNISCLHICNDLLGSKVHENLYKNLKNLEIDQVIYHPSRKHSLPNVDQLDDSIVNNIETSDVLNFSHRLFFRKKIDFLYKDICSKIDITSFDLIHATTLFSDGALALKLYKEYGIPYIVALRGTDINLFIKYRYDLYPLGRKILSNAKYIIFISNSLKKNFDNYKLAKGLNKDLEEKQVIIPNGLDSFWLKNITKKDIKKEQPKNFLYIGKFDTNKNVIRLIQAFLKLNDKHEKLTLNLVGKGGDQEKKVKELAKKHKGTINFHGAIADKKELQKIYQANDVFAMTSLSETFGLVYVEALTQGLPILYSEHQGIDGTFKENVGISVNPTSVDSIQHGLETIIEKYSNFEVQNLDFSRFNWEDIAQTYIKLYSKI